MTQGILYISYDGMLEALGQSQVLAYLKRLAVGRRIHLISFEKGGDWGGTAERKRILRDIDEAGIVWHPLRYHKRPAALATAWDIFCGTVLGFWLVLRYRLRIVHARSYVPSVMALVLKRLTGVKYIFDMRGFWADERKDSGAWNINNVLVIIAIPILGYALAFPLVQLAILVAGTWGIFRFGELRGRAIPVFYCCTVIVFLGAILLAFGLQ